MNKKIIIKFPPHSISYKIEIGNNIFKNIAIFLKQYFNNYRILILSDNKVGNIYSETLLNQLKNYNFKAEIILFPKGEHSKSYKTKERIESKMIKNLFNRSTVLLALGGGVTGDLGGFIAATYMRGIPYIQIPTSLLAMVDSSIGGKVAINHSFGKNLIGAFYQPQAVFIDISTLKTLEKKEFLNGIAEVIKTALIYDAKFFDYLSENYKKILSLNPSNLKHIIYNACSIKADIVMKDEKEKNLRKLLNYGHTIGHAIELLSNYRVPHGFCVSIGINVENRIAFKKGLLSFENYSKVLDCLKKYNLPFKIPKNIKSKSIISKMKIDKKNYRDIINFTLLSNIGQGLINQNVENELIAESIEECK